MIHERVKPDINIIELRPLNSAGNLVLASKESVVVEARPSLLRQHLVFILIVIIPTFLAILYFGWIDSDQYSVEASFIVRTMSNNSGGAALSLLGGNQGFARSEEDTYAVNEYLQSRDAAEKLADQIRNAFGRKEIDFFHRFPNFFNMMGSTSKEALYAIYRNQISISGSNSGISNLEVRAFDRNDAKDLAVRMLKLGEELVNTMNELAEKDSVRMAKIWVDEAQMNFESEQLKLLNYRNRELIIDPQKQSAAALEVVNQLVAHLSEDEATLAQMIALSPKNPQIANLRERVKAYRAQIDIQRNNIVGGKDALVPKLAEFEQISLRRELAARSLSAAIASFETAKNEAQRQQFYLETIVSPVTPDRPRYPYRLIMIVVCFGASLVFFWIFKKSTLLIAEHQA